MMVRNDRDLERIIPEQAGISSASVQDFLDAIQDKRVNLHSFMLLRHGKVAAEGYFSPFDAGRLHHIFSISKSFTSAAVGIAIGEGLLTREDRIVDFFPEKIIGEIHPYTARMTVKDLLAMATVHPKSTNTHMDDWVSGFLNTAPSHPPGTLFAYDTTGTHTLCAILQKLTGMTVHDYLLPRLLEPLGIGAIEWESCPTNINKGGSGIKCTPEDLAKFGQLYLQDGVWNGRRILPEGWVKESTSRQIDNSNTRTILDGNHGYGYQFWRCQHDSYCAFGMGGQLVVVIPGKDVVLVTTANTLLYKDGQQEILNAFWETIYPALAEGPLVENPDEHAALKDRLAHLALYLPEGEIHSPVAAKISGKRFVLDENQLGYESCELHWDPEVSKISVVQGGEKAELHFGMGKWIQGTDPFFGLDSAIAGIWVDEKTCIIYTHILDSVHQFQWTLRFEEDTLTIQMMTVGVLSKPEHERFLVGKLG